MVHARKQFSCHFNMHVPLWHDTRQILIESWLLLHSSSNQRGQSSSVDEYRSNQGGARWLFQRVHVESVTSCWASRTTRWNDTKCNINKIISTTIFNLKPTWTKLICRRIQKQSRWRKLSPRESLEQRIVIPIVVTMVWYDSFCWLGLAKASTFAFLLSWQLRHGEHRRAACWLWIFFHTCSRYIRHLYCKPSNQPPLIQKPCLPGQFFLLLLFATAVVVHIRPSCTSIVSQRMIQRTSEKFAGVEWVWLCV
jgi:hypothetical protein